MKDALPFFSEWPRLTSVFAVDRELELDIDAILGQMTLEEKVGQMLQPDIREVTPGEVTRFKLGSVLNGGGAWPNKGRHASSADWCALATSLWEACEAAFEGRPFRIPLMWGTDAVHGHNNVYSATLFPHNIGLGAANDPELIRRIGEITAIEIATTGMDWTFAPCVATPRHYGWGRVYEGYSEDPEIVWRFASKLVEGLQGTPADLRTEHKVLATAKHWIGDGGTSEGVDRGENHYSEAALLNIHGPGYFSAIEAGVQTIMASFNSWHDSANYDHGQGKTGPTIRYNQKIHGSRYLLTDVLKQKMGFDGLVVSDWSGHAEVSTCSKGNANYAVNAGIDILMVPEREDWQSVYTNLVRGVRAGEISLARIDDAVRRILRVKMRAGLWDKPEPSQRALAGAQRKLGCPAHRALAREAVRKSLVLLKNKDDLLPLSRNRKYLLAGSAADDIQKQVGGWSITWQGTETDKHDFPGATTLLDALHSVVGPNRVKRYHAHQAEKDPEIEVAIVAFGEIPYAEMIGDLKSRQSLELARIRSRYQQDHDTIVALKQQGYKVVTLLYSGRPVYVNNEINHSDAFIAAWWPGSEGGGISDLLFRDAEDAVVFDFTGRLSFSWPNKRWSKAINKPHLHADKFDALGPEQDVCSEHAPLFPYGYGLSYQQKNRQQIPGLNDDALPLDSTKALADHNQVRCLFGAHFDVESRLFVADQQGNNRVVVSANQPTDYSTAQITPVNYQHQQDARRFQQGPAQTSVLTLCLEHDSVTQLIGAGEAAEGAICFDICGRVLGRDVQLAVSIQHSAWIQIEAWRLSPTGQWRTLSFPAELCADRVMSPADDLLRIRVAGACELDIGNLIWQAAN